MLYLKASGEIKQMSQQEKEMGYDKKGVEEGQVLSVAAQWEAGIPPQPGSVLAQTLHRPTEKVPSPKHCRFTNKG